MGVVIRFVLPVQQSLSPQKDKGLEVQSKNENSSFDNTMKIENKKQPKTEKSKQEEAPKKEKKEYLLAKKTVTKEKSIEKKEEKKETEQLLLAVSGQMIAIEQLRVQPESLYLYIQKIQKTI
ncbi:hypothetical protein bcere0029_15620 [Bacillus cereus AH1272]|nr:hypothetical protein bcere0029_15620 [Bacillus cereus AH1272]EEL94392.1 hypothetical protein bcere0030_16040 [Bacillus cereus AH1273]